ncbi:AfsR/SARP family transcriptional regulator [Actinokineospora globicatena]|uniref:AfsR/SARP family transcriptional regulator n=1 Tax=Actinokineospora globicatena TaxID=103729 RepID=UPI0020A3BCEA|nr:tetratricopeptide repeat protein [Actinokineospora globicatena]MCP2301553.1 DNA-binding transcriptional activator of the SARP family [Actinokineospora globicatena]GLW76796.1 SARP family transcriptional regulator [Actinokineospora globicatena]GLW83629.1 SARP family transcriptional regulator [Actinokineospora globicatena]
MDIRILGPIRLHGRVWTATHLKPRSLVALLLLYANKPVSRDRMIEFLWDDDCPAEARQTLTIYISRAKRAFERAIAGARITSTSAGYSLEVDTDRVDYHRFRALVAQSEATDDPAESARQLERAVALWEDGHPLGESKTSYARRMRDDLIGSELIPAYRALFDAKLATGDHDYVLRELPAIREERPHDEHLAGQYMRALHAAGRTRDIPDFHRAFTQRYTAEHHREPESTFRKLHDDLVAGGPQVTDTPPGPALADLPRDTPYFIGREDALRRLDEATARPDALVAIDGPPGVGKTALIARWVRSRMDRFPDGLLYKDFHGFSAAAPLDPTHVMTDFLRQHKISGGDAPEEKAVLLRQLTSRKRLIVVLDNVSDAEHAKPLLAAMNQCPVIISSRQSLTSLALSDNAYLINIQPLDDQRRIELLRTRLGARVTDDPAAASVIAALTDGFPLVLLIAGEHVAAKPSVSLRDLATQLRERILDAGGSPDRTPRTVFSWSIANLDEPERRLFDLLGVHPLPTFSGSVVAAINGADRASTDHSVDRLLSAQLLQQEGADHYRIHDLLHVLAAERATQHTEHDEARRRMVDWYVLSAVAARHQTTPDDNDVPELAATSSVVPARFTDDKTALDWFTHERPNLMEIIRLAARTGLSAQLWRLSAAIYEPIRRLGYLHEALEASRLGISAAEAAGDVEGQAGSINNLGRIFELLHDDAEAIRQYERAHDLFVSIGHVYGQAVCQHNIATLALKSGRLGDADRHFRRSLTLFERDEGKPWAIAKVHHRLGDLSVQLGNLDEAGVQYHLALGLAKQIGDTGGAATTVTALARLHLGIEQFATAVEYGTKALPMHEQVRNRAGTAATLLVLAEARLGLEGGGTVEAEAAAGIFHDLQDQHGRADALEILGRCHSSAGAHERAAAVWQECAELLASIDAERARRVSGWVRAAQARVARTVPAPRGPTPLDDTAEPTRPLPR